VTSSEEIQNIRWATFTGVLGPEVNGIWAKYSATNDVNATDAFFKAEVIVTGDDFGLVKLFRFPSLSKGELTLCTVAFGSVQDAYDNGLISGCLDLFYPSS